MGFPSYIQTEQSDCGATCLKIICKYYKRNTSIAALRDLTKKTRAGVTLHDLSSAAELIGLRSHAYRLSLDQISEEVHLPCILHWSQNHFVVLYKVRNGKFYISDPAVGLLRYNQEEFSKRWISDVAGGTGIALDVSPTPVFFEFEGSTSEKLGFVFLFEYLRPYKIYVAQIILGLLIGSLIGLFPPFLTQSLVDRGISLNNLNFVQLVLVAQVLVALGATSLNFIRSWIMLHVSSRISIALIADYLVKLMRLPIRFFDTKNLGDLRQRIDDNRRIQAFLTGNILNIAFAALTFVLYSFVLAYYNFKLLLIFYIGSILYTLWIVIFLKRRKELDYMRFTASAANQSNVYQLITGMQDIKLYGCERQKRWEWEKIQARLFNISIKGLSLGQNQQAGTFLINQIKNIAISYYAARAVIDGEMTLGMMMSVQYILGLLNSPISELIGFIQNGQDAKISLERLGEIYTRPDEDSENGNITTLAAGRDIIIRNLTFSYEELNSGNVLKNVNIQIPYGRTTAIVGSSGSGKSTLLKLLLRFYAVKSGTIRIGETDLSSLDVQFWRSICGTVLQESSLFSDTIANNIAINEAMIDPDKMIRAARLANIHDFVNSLPQKYETRIGQEGMNLSQGQKQRILIARSIYRDPEYIFFDEATNALDSINEQEIVSNLNDILRGRTVVMIAHRLSTIRHADQIILLHNGEVAECGTHEELYNSRGIYFNMIQSQDLTLV